jgi:DNA-binding MarR family transcriptional regulator
MSRGLAPSLGAVRAAGEDEVDRLVRAWRRERPDLDVGPMQVLSRVTRLAHHLDRARSRVFARHDLAVWEFDVLAALRRSGPPYQRSPGQLLHETLVTSGTMTNRLDRLETKGLVERLPDPVDRRGVIVQLTPGGRRRVDAAIEGLLSEERDLLRGIGADEKRHLADSLRRLVAGFDADGVGPA